MIDPLNPNTETGGLGTNSVVFMPGYVAPDYVLSKTGVAPGQLTENLTIDSTNLGYSVNYRVYTPSGYEKLSELPVLYVTDGQDFLQFGKLDISLDNLIAAGHMRPIIAVFIDPRDVQTGKNLREELFLDNPSYGDFIANELVPVIDQAYRTNPTAEARAILGASHGGYFSVYFALHHADKFHLIGALSPSIWHNQGIVDEYQDAEKLPLKFYIGTGTWSDANYHSALLVDALKEKGYLVEYLECNEGHSYANWRGKFKQLLAYFFPAQEEGQ
jgi:enterochelin esterase family protein